jgi:hypothetical protein
MGLMKTEQTIYNQDGDIVMSMVSNGLIQVRNPDSDAE